MWRNRRVRFSYPEAMAQLAIAVAQRYGKREAAAALRLPLSTLYRWLKQCGDGAQTSDEHLRDLARACERQGFAVATALAGLGMAPPPPAPVPTVSPRSAEIALGSAAADAIGNARLRKRAENARRRIDAYYYSRLSCRLLASEAGVSRWHFIRAFRAAHGVSPYRYLIQVRVGHAKRLLGTTAHSLDAVATAVGFDSVSCLCRAFRSVEGVSLSACFAGLNIAADPPKQADQAA